MFHSSNPSTWNTEAGGLCELESELQANLDYILRLCLNAHLKKKKEVLW